MNVVFYITGLLLVLIVGLIVSVDRRKIRYKPIVIMLLTQLVLTFILLNTKVGVVSIGFVSALFSKLVDLGVTGVNFVFGGLENEGEYVFFLNVLLPIVFISVLIGILNQFKILPFIIKYVGIVLSKLNGMGKMENYIAVSSAVLGQSEVFLTIKDQMDDISKRRLYTFCTSAMSAVSVAIVGAYMEIIEPQFVVVAIALNIMSALIVASIINPYELSEEEDTLTIESKKKLSFFQMISESIMDGFKVAVIVAAMLIGFIALMNGIDYLFEMMFNVSFQTILGYIFAPIAFVMGVPWADSVQAGSIMATKLVTNEFVAMLSFKEISAGLSTKAVGMISVFLVSFANFSSIGIITGAVKALSSKQGDEVARNGLKLLLGSTLASVLSATVIGLFL
ncbi:MULTISPECIES: NupC/NupG family nucleoside CNT transporter [unclassified Sporosarcina]|uniref:NupC/NupG family nucleoside CNT transporter n=1 Tax=unclassified Sporosarcina TaxID=2647733 RepID=UPI000C172C89|nr:MULTISPECIES: nucleoside transporter C-terminal domain-containing protein [unclassified Sporosarcina]PIC97869.1 NupC/NupG family nucleoside CNT transporter [Sporosarcina sp. P29]PID05492.1 NupC/NupG family nucleoside CNT transporter [Sporosarcina sp. P30]PID08667.1 NupC/NupG family nucleoside CNT transporter [Sporosarcina sp. P31]PID11669.1 NupC/NupG family nucleoside CNT transporter [Sporosarcina sp. P32b]